MQTRRPLLRLLYLAEILSPCRLPHICDKFPKGNSLRTEFRSQISNQTSTSKLFSHPRHCNIFLAQSFHSMGREQEGSRIEFEFVASRIGDTISRGVKYLEYRDMMWRRCGMAANRRKRQPPPSPLPPLNFTTIFTWAQYFIGHLMPGHVLSLTGGAVAYESKCALKISFSSRDATDKELAGARTLYGISYVASTLSRRVSSVFSILFSLFPPPSFFLSLSLPLSLSLCLESMNDLYSLRCQQNSSVSTRRRNREA